MEATIFQIMTKANVAGLLVAVINDGQIAYTHAFGNRDKAAGSPFDTQTVTGAASLSKTVFAYLVMLLAEEGIIDLDSHCMSICPSRCRNIPTMPTWSAMIATSRSPRAWCSTTALASRTGVRSNLTSG